MFQSKDESYNKHLNRLFEQDVKKNKFVDPQSCSVAHLEFSKICPHDAQIKLDFFF